METWKQNIEWFTKALGYRELNGVDGEPVEFEWTFFPGHTTLQLLREIQRTMDEKNVQLEQFEDRIILTSMYNDIDWWSRTQRNWYFEFFKSWGTRTEIFWKDICHSSDQEAKQNGMERTHTCKPNGLWNNSAEIMLHLRESGHPLFQATSALGRGSFKSKGREKLSIHNNGDSTREELLLRIVISVNQPSV